MPEPTFVADPNHRRKVLTGELITLADAKVAMKETMTKMDSSRIGKNFAYMIRSLPRLQEDQFEDAAKAVLEHHFDEHQYCGPWCKRKLLSATEKEAAGRYYRCKDKDAKLYVVLQEKVSRFITCNRLKEVAHGMDTLMNESFNNTASWFAPKNKVYCGSQSLRNQLSLSIGINTLGLYDYFTRLYKILGIAVTDNVAHFLRVKERNRLQRLQKNKSREQKKARMKRKFDQLKEHEATAKKERAKRDGTYKTGLNMQEGAVDGYTMDDLMMPARKHRRSHKDIICPHCNRKGHSTTRSRQCLYHNGMPRNIPLAAASMAVVDENAQRDDADDLDAMDSMPLQDDPPSNMSISEFKDAGTWSSDDEDGQAFGII